MSQSALSFSDGADHDPLLVLLKLDSLTIKQSNPLMCAWILCLFYSTLGVSLCTNPFIWSSQEILHLACTTSWGLE